MVRARARARYAPSVIVIIIVEPVGGDLDVGADIAEVEVLFVLVVRRRHVVFVVVTNLVCGRMSAARHIGPAHAPM
jgi:hypothetical protein